MTTTELPENPQEPTENNLQQEESQPLLIAIEEGKKKLIQKETVQTGSVSSIDQIYFLFNIP